MKKLFNMYWIVAVLTATTLFSCTKSNDYFENFEVNIKEFDGNTWDYIYEQYGMYDSLVLAIERFPELKSYLRDSANVTLFGVNNRSFEIAMSSLNKVRAQGNKSLLSIEGLNASDLDTLLSYYIIQGKYNTSDIENLKEGLYVYGYKSNYQMHIQFQNSSASGLKGFGPQQIVFSDTNGRVFHRFWTRTTTSSINVKTSNGYVHMLNSGHDFGFNNLIRLFNN